MLAMIWRVRRGSPTAAPSLPVLQLRLDVDGQLQALGQGVRPVQQHQVADQADGLEGHALDGQAAGLGGLGVEGGVQHGDQVLGGVEGGVQLLAGRGGPPALAGRGGQDVGHAGQAVADFVAEGGDDVGLGAGDAFGRLQHGQPLFQQGSVGQGQGVLPTQHAVEDQRQGHGQGDRPEGHGAGPLALGLGEQQVQRPGGRDRGGDQQGQQAGGGEEDADHGRAGRQQQQGLAHRARPIGEGGHLTHRHRPQQAGHHMHPRPPSQVLGRIGAQPGDHAVEDAPVDREHREADRHPAGVPRERAGPDIDRQADGEHGQRIGQQGGLGVERQAGVVGVVHGGVLSALGEQGLIPRLVRIDPRRSRFAPRYGLSLTTTASRANNR
jgi:hypothetical protein